MAEDKTWQLGVHAQSISTDSESKAEEQEIKPKPTTVSAEIDNISRQHTALLRKAVFDTVPGIVKTGKREQQPEPLV